MGRLLRAEVAIIPEIKAAEEQITQMVANGFRKSKNSSIVLVAESETTGGAMGVAAERLKESHPEYDVRVSILGHMQSVAVAFVPKTVSLPAVWVWRR